MEQEYRLDERVDFRGYYEAEEQLRVRDEREAGDEKRLAQVLRFLGRSFRSLLDAGCGECYFLDYVSRHCPGAELHGIELAANRVRRAQERFPSLTIRQGDIARLPYEDDRFDAVTGLEVLEHLPDWQSALRELLRVSRRHVLVSVPYRRPVRWEVCVHCHRPTPAAGHLHMFCEASFEALGGPWTPKFGYIRPLRAGLVRGIWHRLTRNYVWLLAKYSLA